MKDAYYGWKRFWRVFRLFFQIFWSFYSLRFTRLWHKEGWAQKRRQELWSEQARYFRTTAVELGGLLIKLGQFFSTRVDLFPSQAIRELENLQDEVKAVPYDEIATVIEEEFGRPVQDVYASFAPEAIAAASLGQVHRAFLPDGQEVAVKVLRPGIQRLVEIDLKAVNTVFRLLKRFLDMGKFMDIDLIYEEVRDTVYEELDYIQEGQHAEKLAQYNALPEQVLIPKIFWDYTTRRVLTMEFMHGIKISNYHELDQAGIDREYIARLLVQVYCQQVLVDGFFHADPHPGNLFVSEDAKLIMVDFGMTGSISPQLRELITELALAATRRDHLQVVGYLKTMGFLHAQAREEKVARAVGLMLERFLGSGEPLTDDDFAILLDDLEDLLYEQPFQIPGSYTVLGRAAGTLYGLCISLYPSINFLDEMQPYLESFVGGKRGLFSRIRQESKDYVHSLVELPPLTNRVLHRLEDGNIQIQIDFQELIKAEQGVRRAMYSLGMIFIFGFILLASVYLLVHGLRTYALIGFIISLITLLISWRSMHRASRRSSNHPDFIPRDQRHKR